MKGREMVVSALDSPPFVIMGNLHPEVSGDVNTGTDFLFVEAMGKTLNFTFRTVQPEDGNYGYPQEDGSVTGMIGMVARREANIALGGIAVNDKRDTVIDYVYPYMLGPLCVYSRSPKLKNRALAVLSPFTYEVWICLIIAAVMIGPIAYVEAILSHSCQENGPLKTNLQDYSYNMFRNIVNQGNLLSFSYWSQRILVYSWFLYCLITAALYSGTLTAVLAIPAYEKPIDSLEDLPKAAEDGFTIGVIRDSTNEYIFKEASDGLYKQIWDLFNHEDRSQSFLEDVLTGVQKVLKEKFVFIGPDIEFIILAETFGGRKFHYGHQCFYPQGAAFPVPPGAPYLQLFNKITLRLVEGGFYDKWETDAVWNVTKGSSSTASADEEDDSGSRSFTVIQLQSNIALDQYLDKELSHEYQANVTMFIFTVWVFINKAKPLRDLVETMVRQRSREYVKLEARRLMIHLRKNGVSVRDISAKCGYSTTTVYRWLLRWKVERSISDKRRRLFPYLPMKQDRPIEDAKKDNLDLVKDQIAIYHSRYQHHLNAIFRQRLRTNPKDIMTRVVSAALTIIVIALSFQSAGSYDILFPDEHLLAFSRSKRLENELTSFIEVLGEERLDLQILQDQNSKGMVNELTKQLSEDGISSMVLDCTDASFKLAEILLNPSMRMTLLLILCPPVIVEDIFNMIHTKRLQSHFVKWLLLIEKQNTTKNFLESLEKLIFEGTQIILLLRGSTEDLTISASYTDGSGLMHFSTPTPLKSKTRAKLHQLLVPDYKSIYSNMKGREMVVAAVDSPPYSVMGDQHPEISGDVNTGTDFAFVEAMAKTLNFTFRTVHPVEGFYGYPQPDGTVTGMIGMVARREANIAVGGVAVNEKRKTVVDYSIPYMESPLRVYSRSPKLKNNALAVLSSFTSEVWACIIIATLLMGPIVYIETLISKKKKDHEVSLQTCSFNVYRNIVNQGNRLIFNCWSQRLLIYSWFLFCLVTAALYSGTLTAVLAIPAYENPIDSLEDIPVAVEDGFTVGVTKGTSNEYLFKEATDGIYKQIWGLFNHKDKSRSFITSLRLAVKKILSEKFVFIGPDIEFIIITETYGRRKFHYGRQSFYPQVVAFPVPQGAPYREVFSIVTLRLVEGGFYKKWETDAVWNVTKSASGVAPGEGEEEDSKERSFTLTQLQAAFFLVLLGYSSAGFILMLEFLTKRWTSKN
ncbi:uncharacterized protein [Palaemon carinicauda]|uniref:uncharacterized protein n=1 Tax=Palaemon carinicauda TaxID=392227 RepID=UPI0035B601EE